MSSSMQVTIPSHIGPGGTFDIRTLNGNIVMVTCPPDKVGGMNMIVTLDEKGLFVASNATQVQPVQVQPVQVQPVLVQQQPVVVHAQPFQLQPGTVAVVHDQVMVREQQSILLHELSIHPHHGVCPNCKQDVVTICEQQRCTGDQCGVCMASVGALACFCWPCLFVCSPCIAMAFCMNPDYVHTCPNCQYYIGTKRGMRKVNDREG